MKVTKTYGNSVRSAWRVEWMGRRKTFAIDSPYTDDSPQARSEVAKTLLKLRQQIKADIERDKSRVRIKDLSQTRPADYATMLEALDDRRVVSFTLAKDRRMLEVGERCDYYFAESLDKAQAQQLVNELQDLVNQMKGL